MLRNHSFKFWLCRITLVIYAWINVFVVGAQPSFAFNQADVDKLASGYTMNCSNCDLSGADLKEIDIPDNYSFIGANLTGADLSAPSPFLTDSEGRSMVGVNFTNANLTGANLSGTIMTDVQFSFANVTGADLSSSQIYRSNADLAVFDKIKTDDFTSIEFQSTGIPRQRTDLLRGDNWYRIYDDDSNIYHGSVSK